MCCSIFALLIYFTRICLLLPSINFVRAWHLLVCLIPLLGLEVGVLSFICLTPKAASDASILGHWSWLFTLQLTCLIAAISLGDWTRARNHIDIKVGCLDIECFDLNHGVICSRKKLLYRLHWKRRNASYEQ